MKKLLHILSRISRNFNRENALPDERTCTPSIAPFTLTEGGDKVRLALASQFFDPGWYLARYPDVAAAGLDPLIHFLSVGIGEGRDPGPLFDTKWYLANNPDVAAAGVNPLIHYIQYGASEGRNPNPSTILRQKIKGSSEEIELSSSEGIGEKANDYNTIELRSTWRKYFLSEAIGAHNRGDFGASLKNLASAIQVCPEFNDTFSRFRSVFLEYNRDSLALFERTYARSKLVVAHVSCRPKLACAELSSSSFFDPTSEVETLRIIGDGSLPENKFHFDATRRLLIVPANDAYEGLPKKVIKAFLFMGFSCITAAVLKLDDDVICDDLPALKTTLNEVLSKSDYGGRVLPPATRLSDSQFWHFGKCENPNINFRPDGHFFFCSYAAGACYWLNGETINLLSKVALLHDRYFETELYEDRAIGTALNYYGIRPYHHDLIAAGRVRYSDPEIQDRHLETLGRA